MEDQYGMADLRQYMTGRTYFPPISWPPPPADTMSSHLGLTSPQYPYDMLMFRPDSTIIAPSVTSGGASSSVAGGSGLSGFEMEGGGGDGGGTGRWPRQETLALLEIRSRLDPKFKEANQKGPLWEEVSRIMAEEHGYQRTGKKCREKFENLYKYYKKTKEGKAGRQDGKHYRFFRQLEALYGENSTNLAETHFDFQYSFPNNNVVLANNQEFYPGPKFSDTSLISVSNNSSDHSDTTSSSDDTNNPKTKKRRGKRISLKAKIKDFIDSQMRKLMEKQEAWMEKMMTTIEHKEQERILREEQWRKKDAERLEREHKLWASERAWIEARDAALMEAFRKLSRNETRTDDSVLLKCDQIWPECEITRLIQLRTQMELKFQENGISEEVLWEEIARKMACFGHERSALMCKEKWDSVNNYLLKCNKKRKEINSKSCCTFYQNHGSIYDHQDGVADNYCFEQGIEHHAIRLNDQNAGNLTNDGFFRYFMEDSYGGRIMN